MDIRRVAREDRFNDLMVGRGGLVAAALEQEDARWRRAKWAGILGTAILHFLILLMVREARVEPTDFSAAAGPAMGDVRAAAGGGSGLTMVEVQPQQERVQEEVVPEPEPVPEPVIVPREVVPVEPTPTPRNEPAATPSSQPGTGGPGAGGQDGPANGPGNSNGAGDGAGGGGAGDGGGASRVVPPTPRGIFIPPSGQPASARGQEITVWVFVTATGRVDRNQIRLEPPTSDSGYNRRLMQSVAEWVFDPAREDGRPVPVWYPFQIIL